MITEKDLLEAIAECQGTRNPNANTCIKLASFYTILDHVKEQEKQVEMYPYYISSSSHDAHADEKYESDSEFGRLVTSVNAYDAMLTIDELMETLRIMQPRLYDAFIRKLTALK